ncbi:MAG: DUF1829 domain-containing protein [Nitrospirae bacterium]|nr:DUF1829 domain-containing protein [Nitrospirota bacterium]MBF0534773.1 DUF1829 domain-containing protein [Nitrospirota bacterium]MBF0616447.1 DUF1829 domain-containing protein [Nitrospirota bacterium]
MINEIQKHIDTYIVWLKDKTALRQVKDWIEITTPYLDRHNDYLQIYVKRQEHGFIFTDDGYTIEDLKQSGCELQSMKRKELLTFTLNGFGVKLENNSLTIQASSENFALKKHNLIQAILAVNDLFYLAAPMVTSLFLEDVTSWLKLCDIRYTPNINFTGKSGFVHRFDFVIPASKQQPERILKAINRPGRDSAEGVAFSWFDTKVVRPANSRAYAFLNDSEHAPAASVLDAIKSYNVKPVLWSEREEIREELAA